VVPRLYCPIILANGTLNACNGDFSCDGNLKCCAHACSGKRCTVPVRSGSCPVVVPVTPCPSGISKKSVCSEDFNCTGGHKKCCANECGALTCQQAVKPGNCPAVIQTEDCMTPRNTTNLCAGDYSCPTNEKCCPHQCTGNQCAAPVGICPATEPDEMGVCVEECSDSDPCTGGKVCCSTACGGTVCD